MPVISALGAEASLSYVAKTLLGVKLDSLNFLEPSWQEEPNLKFSDLHTCTAARVLTSMHKMINVTFRKMGWGQVC